MADIDLTIPASAPGLIPPRGLATRALYSMIPLSDKQLDEACDVVTKEERDLGLGRHFDPSPNPHISSTSLRAIFDYHLKIDDSKWDTNWFVVITSKDWRKSGVLMVTMGILNEDKPDAVFTDPEWASLEISSLSCANTTWADKLESNWGSPREGRKKGNGGSKE